MLEELWLISVLKRIQMECYAIVIHDRRSNTKISE